MILKKIPVETALGEPTNCYIVEDEQTKEAMCVDPGGEPEKIIEMLDTLGIDNLKYIYLTHCHGDHFGGILELKEKKGGKVLIRPPTGRAGSAARRPESASPSGRGAGWPDRGAGPRREWSETGGPGSAPPAAGGSTPPSPGRWTGGR